MMSTLSLNDNPDVEQTSSEPTRQSSGHVTLILMGLNILIFIVMVASGVPFLKPTASQVLPWGADFGPLTTSGQWWRLVSSCFLHFGIINIGMNMFILFQIGLFTELLFGKTRYLALYLLAGIGGNIAGLYLHPFTVSAGASGAIFGLYGGMLAFLLVRRGIVPHAEAWKIARSAGIFILYNFVYGIASPTTDMVAHIGGLITGFVVGCALAWTRGYVPGFPARMRVGVVAVGSVVALGAALMFVPKADSSQSEWYRQEVGGTSVPLGGGRVIYSGTVTRDDAQKAAQALLSGGFAQHSATVMLARDTNGTSLSLELDGDDKAPKTSQHLNSKVVDGKIVIVHETSPADPLAWDDPKFLTAVKVLGPRVAMAVGGPPLTVRLLNRDGQLKREVKIDSSDVTIGQNDHVQFSGKATAKEATALGAALKSYGFFRDTGALVHLTKSTDGTSVSFNLKEGAWDKPAVLTYMQTLGKKIAPSVGGLPLKEEILDDDLTVRKELQVK